MIKTFEIDLDDALVENASEIFEALGTDIDTAIKMFLTQATLRQGFPFEVVIPNEIETPTSEPELASIHDGVSEEEEMAAATAAAVSEPQIVENVQEAVIEPQIAENEKEPIAEASEENPVPPISPEVAARVAANEALVAQMRAEIGDKNVVPEFDENEEEDETTPDNLFDAWDVGEEEDIGCR